MPRLCRLFRCCGSGSPLASAGLKPLTLNSLHPAGAKSTKASFDVARKPASRPATIVDVELTSRRSLVGSVIDAQGNTIAGETVTARLGRRALAETKTDRQGQFRFQNVRGSVFEVPRSTAGDSFASGRTERLRTTLGDTYWSAVGNLK